jgi:CubicO group peptidase (beta-lactamase class C family)
MPIALPRSTPEAQGVPSAVIQDYVDSLLRANTELHGLVIVRHGHLIVERWWEPYRRDAVHLLYSMSKSFTSTAAGFAIAEGRFGLDDLVIDHFADAVPDEIGEHLAALRVRHLLGMSAGHADDSTWIMSESDDWPRSFLAQPFAHEPGTEFLYDSGATFMVSALVQRTTGQTIVDYLRPRLFDPLGMGPVETHLSPDGVATGGWGMSVTTEALAALGELYLRDGVWNGERVLPAGWVAEATRAHIVQPADFMSEEWHQGYGFQFWMCRHGAYRGDGAFGQFTVVMPEQDTVVAITSSTADLQGVLDAIWDILLPALGDTPLSASAAVASPAMPDSLPLPERPDGVRPAVQGTVEFRLEPNPVGLERLVVETAPDGVTLTLDDERIEVGIGRWVDAQTTMPFTPPEIGAFRDLRGPFPAPFAAAGGWTDPDTFAMRWQYYTTPHHDVVTLRFSEGGVELEFLNSITAAAAAAYPTLPAGMDEPRPILRGTPLS